MRGSIVEILTDMSTTIRAVRDCLEKSDPISARMFEIAMKESINDAVFFGTNDQIEEAAEKKKKKILRMALGEVSHMLE